MQDMIICSCYLGIAPGVSMASHQRGQVLITSLRNSLIWGPSKFFFPPQQNGYYHLVVKPRAKGWRIRTRNVEFSSVTSTLIPKINPTSHASLTNETWERMTGKEIMNGEGKDLDGSLDSRLSTNDLIIHAIEWVWALLVLWEKTWWILSIVREEDFCELVKTE